jgi:Ca2+-binding RTX toxin-like protein
MPRLYNATWTISKSDGTQTTSPFSVDVHTIMQRFYGQGETELVIGGGDGVSDQILLLPASSGTKFVPPGVSMIANEPAMRILYNGSDMGAFIANRVVTYGQGGNDLIQVDARITKNAQLFGQAGNDILVGGSGHDILVGSKGDDILYGFNGLDVLFGGLGRDYLQGASWNGSATASDSDLLVGSFVAFDYDINLVRDVALRWSSATSYNAGIDSIRSVYPWLRQNVTIFDDWSLDYVFGSGDLDWFWVEPPPRDNFDAQGNEFVN